MAPGAVPRLLGPVLMASAIALALAAFTHSPAPKALHHGPRRITFGLDALYFDPPLADRGQIHGVKEVTRGELGAIRFPCRAGTPGLTIDRGVQRLDVGSGLSDVEREWLAGVLRAWAGRQTAPSAGPGRWAVSRRVRGPPG